MQQLKMSVEPIDTTSWRPVSVTKGSFHISAEKRSNQPLANVYAGHIITT